MITTNTILHYFDEDDPRARFSDRSRSYRAVRIEVNSLDGLKVWALRQTQKGADYALGGWLRLIVDSTTWPAPTEIAAYVREIAADRSMQNRPPTAAELRVGDIVTVAPASKKLFEILQISYGEDMIRVAPVERAAAADTGDMWHPLTWVKLHRAEAQTGEGDEVSSIENTLKVGDHVKIKDDFATKTVRGVIFWVVEIGPILARLAPVSGGRKIKAERDVLQLVATEDVPAKVSTLNVGAVVTLAGKDGLFVIVKVGPDGRSNVFPLGGTDRGTYSHNVPRSVVTIVDASTITCGSIYD